METLNTWRPNQSGTFSNRVNIHDADDDKIFTIEFHDKVTNAKDRIAIVNKVCASPDLYEALQSLIEHVDKYDQLLTWDVDIARKALQKAV